MASLEQCTVGGSTYNLSVPFIAGTGSTAGTWLGQLDGLTEYYDGLLILYKPSVAGASTTTLNLNSLGAKTCYINNTTKLTTHFPANQPILLAYSSSQNSGCFMCIDNYWTNSDTYTSAKCDTAAATAAKGATCTHYTATANTFLHILMRYANTVASALTLNVNSQGAKPIYINGEASSASNYTLPAGTYIIFYDGTNYYFNTDGTIPHVGGGGGSEGIWTSSETGLVGDTYVSINNPNISLTSTITPYCENASGVPITITSVTIVNGKVTLRFPALTETTTFKVLISSNGSAEVTPINAEGVFIDTNNLITSGTYKNTTPLSYTATQDCVVLLSLIAVNSHAYAYINGVNVIHVYGGTGTVSEIHPIYVKKGQVLTATTGYANNSDYTVYGIQQGSHANVLIDYSTEEQFTGQHWIDGKDIYTQYIDFGTHKMNQNTGSNAWIGEQYLNSHYVIPVPSGTITQYLDCYANVENGYMYPVICGPSSHSNLVFMHFRDNSTPVFTGLWIKYVKQ